jgi:peptidyl-prolyl cis-trans isomerase D
MISWIQRTFQQHFRVIFSLLLGVIVISFIFTIGATPGIGRGDRKVAKRDFFGHNLGSQEELQRMMFDARVSAELQFGFAEMDADQIERYGFQRAAGLYLADQLRIPPATPVEVAAYIKNLRAFTDESGQFDAARYAAFRASLKSGSGANEGQIARVIADDVRFEAVEKLLAGPGYVLPADVKDQVARADTRWTLATATLDYAGYHPTIEPTGAQLEKFFADNAFRYQIPPKVAVDYVAFPAATFVREVTVSPAEVKAYYDRDPSRFPAPAPAPSAVAKAAPATAAGAKPGAKVGPLAAAPPAKPDPAADFAAVRPAVEAALKLERARNLAAKAASDAAFGLYEGKITPGAALAAYLSTHQLTATPVAPFTAEAAPAELGGGKELADAAFRLNAERYYSEALPTPAGSVVLLWKQTLPERQPLLAEVKDRVRTDYIEEQRRQRFVELGRTLKTAIAAKLKAGEPFAQAVAEAGAAAGVKPVVATLPAFTLRDRPKDADQSVLGTLERLSRGQVSDMIATADRGILVYAADKQAPDLTDRNPRYAETRVQLASYAGRLGSGADLGELVENELKRTAPAGK